ncbi:hypothetical protein PoB_006866900 [Plakobranchus ocellatus]|uniref:Uncharacterized protein n=1 Tax=Plakobranchus ocellatus TaxID=259542 RepID=A0AAV4DDG2_9GAST|nr:hypothetical protein PoB_006866900 [Plakobranchus ocellatus]
MSSSIVQYGKRESVSERFPPFDDSVSLRLTPTPSGNYRCPVSTPANFVHCTGKIRRTKPLHDVIRSTQPSLPTNGRGKLHRSKLTALTRASRPQRTVPRTGRGIDFYFVDPHENQREEQVTNTHWLKALCAQPVEEILGKYRRRTQVSMVRMCSTPGERSLLNAWESNTGHSRSGSTPVNTIGRGWGGKKTVKSAVAKGAGHSASSTLANSPDRRATKSEPALSRTQQTAEHVERYGLSPRASAKEEGKGSNRAKTLDDKGNRVASPDGPPKRIKGFLLDEAASDEENGREAASPPRYVSFTTQVIRQTDEKGNARTYQKMTRGPEHLPYISNSKRVISMVHNTTVYTKGPVCSSENLPGNDVQPEDAKPGSGSVCDINHSTMTESSSPGEDAKNSGP